MIPIQLVKTVKKLIRQARYDEVPTLLEQAASKMNLAEKERLIPLAEDAGLECYYYHPGFFAAGRCFEIAADLSGAVYGEGDDRAVRRFRRAMNHYAGPDCHLSNAQARQSAAQAVVLAQRLRTILERYRPDDRQTLADTIVLQVFAKDFGDRLSETDYRHVKELHNQTFKIVAEVYGERSAEFAGCCVRIADFFKRNGHEQESLLFRQRHDEIMAALEGAES